MAYETELTFAKDLAREAGAHILTHSGSATWKSDNTPLTQTDISNNALIIDKVRHTFPGDGVLGEEASYEPDRNRVWVVDPVDGTQPLVAGIPVSTCCIALVVDGVTELGVVYDPFLQNMYWAVKGQGAFVNDQLLHVSDAAKLAEQFVMVSSRQGVPGTKSVGQLVDAVIDAGGKAFNLRSVAYGMMRVAHGAVVASVAGSFGPWDVAAATLILQEAGAKVTDFYGDPITGNDKGFLATNGHVHDDMLTLIRA